MRLTSTALQSPDAASLSGTGPWVRFSLSSRTQWSTSQYTASHSLLRVPPSSPLWGQGRQDFALVYGNGDKPPPMLPRPQAENRSVPPVLLRPPGFRRRDRGRARSLQTAKRALSENAPSRPSPMWTAPAHPCYDEKNSLRRQVPCGKS